MTIVAFQIGTVIAAYVVFLYYALMAIGIFELFVAFNFISAILIIYPVKLLSYKTTSMKHEDGERLGYFQNKRTHV